MPATNFNLSLTNAVDFQDSVQGAIGHLTSLQIGTADNDKFATDITLKNPHDGSDTSVVGPLSSIYWGGEPSDPIEFTVGLSNRNHQTFEQIAQRPPGNVEFSVVVYEFDQVAKRGFFVAFRGSALIGPVATKSDGDDVWSFGQSEEQVPSVPWELSVAVMPHDSGVQRVTLATTPADSVEKPWGAIQLHPPGTTGVSTPFGGPGSDR